MNRILFCLTILLLVTGCNYNQREKTLEQREVVLSQKEKDFAAKEADYLSLIKMRDSLQSLIKDSNVVEKTWPDSINGGWSSRVVCTESNCNDYVIGDQKTNETWNFTNDSAQILTQIINNNKLIRAFNGRYDTHQINLIFQTDSIAPKQVVMNVLLNNITPTNIKGIQTITVNNSCTAKFSVELTRISNK